MSENVLDLSRLLCGENSETAQRISVSIRKVSRQCRDEILSSHGYSSLWLGDLTVARYVQLLRAHYVVRQALEAHFDSLSGVFAVTNHATQEQKLFRAEKYVTERRRRAQALREDLEDLVGPKVHAEPVPPMAFELIKYMQRVKEVYSAGLLGVLYMLEESLTFAGPRILRNVQRQLPRNATRYLSGALDQKADLWQFRKSLDLIADYQTQVNIVTAANLSYGLYRNLLDPISAFPALHSRRLR
jgi:heme oxygenase